MPFIKTEIPGLFVFEPKVFEDARGYFFESYNEKNAFAEGVTMRFVQDNQARSSYGVVRGLHYQSDPHAQTKLVRALAGTILDVAVDIREGSPTFGKVFTLELSAENKKQLLVPRGFAHGYAVLSETAEVMYKCDAFYNKETEGSIHPLDPALNIDWRIPASSMLLSEKDTVAPFFEDCLNTFTYNPTAL